MINLKKLRKSKGYRIITPDVTVYNDPAKLKKLRDKRFKMSQRAFGEALGVSVKTVENWENKKTKNNLPAVTLKLLYLLDKYPALINDLYLFADERAKPESNEYPLYTFIDVNGTNYGRCQMTPNSPVISFSEVEL